MLDRLRQQTGVVRVVAPEEGGTGLVAPDGRAALAVVTLGGDRAGTQRRAPQLQRLLDEQTRGTPLRAYLVGYSPVAQEVVDAENADAARAERIGLPIALLVLLLALGAVVAAVLPITTGGLSVLVAFGVLGVVSLAVALNGILAAVVPMIGLGVGIDYAMFIVTRFREELARSQDRTVAIAATMRTSGATVLFSGVMVMLCLLPLTIIRAQVFRHLALGISLAVATAMLTALTLLPAVLVLLGRHVERLRRPSWRTRAGHRPWLARWVGAVMRRPLLVTVATVAVLLVAALPVLHLRPGIDLGASGLGDSATGQGTRILAERFSPNAVMPLDVLSTGPDPGLADRIRALPGVAGVVDDPPGGQLSVVLSVAPDSPAALDVVRQVRALSSDVLVGGPTAEFLDLADETRDKTWPLVGLVLALSFVLLTVVFRSLLLPLKAVVMNLLATGAAYGLLVWGFQDGHLARSLDFVSSGSIQAYLPPTAFALLFGLSMDYEVFLVRRIQEGWHATGDTTRAVADGLRHTARPITAAAAIMAAVFGSFVTSDVLELKQIGFGLAAAVLIDATLIRVVLVPAVMRLAGRWNWWLPAPLARVLPHVDTD